ncbi:hypothetical protein Hdeb2414_s0011g00363641 [Helianthus debilis subsp. tardiflorus]
MYVACAKIISLEADVANLKKSEAAFKEKYEEAKSHRERVEVELNAQILSKDRDLAGKDVEIAKLKRRLRKAQEGQDAEKQKVESFEILTLRWRRSRPRPSRRHRRLASPL